MSETASAAPASNAGTASPAPAAAPAPAAPAAAAQNPAPADTGAASAAGAPAQKDVTAPATNSILSGETKPAEAAPAEGADAAADTPAEPAKPQPVEYKDFKLPEGVQADSPMLKSFQETASQFGVPQEAAQEIVAAVNQHLQEQVEAPYKAWSTLNDEWQSKVKADPEIGGDKLPNVLATVSKVMDDQQLTDPEFRQALALTGAGNHPAIIKTLHRWASMLSEGSPVRAGNPAAQPRKSAAEKFYPSYPQS